MVTDDILLVTYTGTGACTITIPTAQIVAGRSIRIIDSGGNASVNNITVVGQGGELISGSASAILSGDYNSIDLTFSATAMFIA